MKKAIKYLTPEEFYDWEKRNCVRTECNICPFKSVKKIYIRRLRFSF